VDSELGCDRFAGDNGMRHPEIMNHPGIVPRGEIFPNRASHLGGHIKCIENVLDSYWDAK
jgi:hypothetical protein